MQRFMEMTTKISRDEQSYYSYHTNCIRNNYLLGRLSHYATTGIQEMQSQHTVNPQLVTASYEEIKLT